MKNKQQENKLRLLVKSILIKENSGGFLDGSDDPSFLKKMKKAQDHTLKSNTLRMAQGGDRKNHPGGNKKKFTADEIETILDALKDDEESDWYLYRNDFIEDEGYSQDQANRAADKEMEDDMKVNPKLYMKYLNESLNENTVLMQNLDILAQVRDVIQTLKNIEVDGETMEYILHQVGMEDQMANQLVNNKRSQYSDEEIEDLYQATKGGNKNMNETKKEGGIDIKQSIKVIKEWIKYFELEDDEETEKEYKWVDNYLYGQTSISKKEFKEIWQHMADEYGVGDIGADWDGFDEVWKDVQSGTLINETKKEDKEEEEDIETPEQEPTEDVSTEDVDPDVKAVQDALTQAAATAAKLNDPKLVDQIGNTVTYFTRTHIVDAPKHQDEPTSLNENQMFKLWNKIK